MFNFKKAKPTRGPDKAKERVLPFMDKNRPVKGEYICQYCSAVYEKKHWQPLAKLDPKYIDRLIKTTCPACHKEKGHISDGVLTLSGSFVPVHHKELMAIVLKTEEDDHAKDVENRVEKIEAANGKIIVYTGKNQLAVKIGKRIDSAYKGGKLEIKWSKKDKPVDVRWSREMATVKAGKKPMKKK